MRTDLGSLLAIGVGAVGGMALTAAFMHARSDHHHVVFEDMHVHRKSEVVWITPAPTVRLEHDIHVVVPQLEMAGPEIGQPGREERRVRVRVEPRVRTERRR